MNALYLFFYYFRCYYFNFSLKRCNPREEGAAYTNCCVDYVPITLFLWFNCSKAISCHIQKFGRKNIESCAFSP